MFSIFKKEVNLFLSSLIGYMSIAVFLLGTGLFVWFFPDYSIIDYGMATLEPFFRMAPYILLFLIPAITMRTFAEEMQVGTFELLATRPISDWQILLGKYFASIFLLLLAILPTLVYYFSVYELGLPKGNIDTGATFGSYIGLYFLGCVFVAIGIFASALMSNQIVAFIFALFLCAFCFDSFSSIAKIPIFYGGLDAIIEKIGINYHYMSMSRGLVALSDVVYFLSAITIFLAGTKTLLERRQW
jgi:ABC-2 type transport system permease protein